MSRSMSWSEREDFQVGEDNKATSFLHRYNANELARASLILAEEAHTAHEEDKRSALYVEAGAFASLAIMRKMIADGEINPQRVLPDLPQD